MNYIHLVSNKVWGGGERYVLDLCKALRADGHTPAVVARPAEAVTCVFADEQLLYSMMPLHGLGGLLAPVRLASLLNRFEGPTVVHVHNFKDASVALGARSLARSPENIRVVATRHLVKPASRGASSRRIYAGLDAVIFVSQLALDAFLSSDPEIDRDKLHVIHNSVALDPFEDKKPEKAEINIVFAGRLVPEKGLDVLLKALAKLPADMPWRLTVCGTGTGRVVMPTVRLARSLGINDRIDWLGHVDDVAPILREADIAVMPSVWAEPFGLFALEALSARCALVTTDNGAQTEYLTDGETALLVPPGDERALADALRRLMTDKTLRETIARNGLNHYKSNLSYSDFYKKTLNVVKFS